MTLLYAFIVVWVIRAALAAFKFKIIVEVTLHDIATATGMTFDIEHLRLQRSVLFREFVSQLVMPIRRARRFGDGSMAITNTWMTPTVRETRDKEHLPFISLVAAITEKSQLHPGRFLVYTKDSLSVIGPPEK